MQPRTVISELEGRSSSKQKHPEENILGEKKDRASVTCIKKVWAACNWNSRRKRERMEQKKYLKKY